MKKILLVFLVLKKIVYYLIIRYINEIKINFIIFFPFLIFSQNNVPVATSTLKYAFTAIATNIELDVTDVDGDNLSYTITSSPSDILSMIMYIFELDAKLVSKIKDYQSKEGLQNEKGLDRYIDKILTEKSREEI
jgi:hypothetical protein